MSVLYMVATPIGNLEDLTLRAIATLKKVSLVAAEDTRRTLALLTHLGIRVTMLSCRAYNEDAAAAKIIAVLNEGKDVAYVSDAGSPALSDPGALLAHKTAANGHLVVPVPGPSAFSTLVSVAGFSGKTIVFEGFLSPKSGRRRTRLKTLLDMEVVFVVYESPFRILKLLFDLAELDSARAVCAGREMTKLHEEFIRGTAAEVFALLSERKDIRGEFAVCVSGNKADEKKI
ncbi:MAG: 16S rRNA (cytidine(1402)-2'-O)-methyltransferase [Spirochaetaceae bacterium]|jgi:16S rRNA (cytidine1402-2'-O)-methyltransferase|nr:16S rRNA (cytidine(1402)-2'-O)-methyltransferase [Spirochaetaceae bacterium]